MYMYKMEEDVVKTLKPVFYKRYVGNTYVNSFWRVKMINIFLLLVLNKLACQYNNIMLMGDFNLTVENKHLKIFMNTTDLECLIKNPTCFLSAHRNCTDLVLTNKNEFFKNSNVLEVGISDHRSFGKSVNKMQRKIKFYRDYSSFQMETFETELDQNLKSNTSFKYFQFQKSFVSVLHKHAPKSRFNNSPSPFTTKTLKKAIMPRSKLKNIYNRKRTDYTWAKNLIYKTKNDYFQNLNITDLSDNKKF